MIDIERYGGKRGLLEHLRTRALYAVGAYGDIRGIDWAAVERLVFICKGNICRSPYASVRAQSMGMQAVSFGLAAMEGAPADPVASRNALSRGIDLTPHRSAAVKFPSLRQQDLVVVFEPAHLTEVRKLSRRRQPISLLGIWAQPIHPHIQDPFGRSDRYFQRCFSLIDVNVAALVSRISGEGPRRARRCTLERPSPNVVGDTSCNRMFA